MRLFDEDVEEDTALSTNEAVGRVPSGYSRKCTRGMQLVGRDVRHLATESFVAKEGASAQIFFVDRRCYI
jgi:hypothetical protein